MKRFSSFYKKYKKQIKAGISVAAILLPFTIASVYLLFGEVTLWYDPARDLMSAWSNLQKPTLIGPTSGIPGIFYGPYWVWLLSIGSFFSKDPIVITLITATLPYFVLFPLLWFRFSKILGLKAVLIGWLLFICTNGMLYSTALWNPYPAPLLTLAVIYFVLFTDLAKISWINSIRVLLIGVLLGLVINFHISFGIGLLFGTLLYIVTEVVLSLFKNRKNQLTLLLSQTVSVLLIGGGLFAAFLPTLLFEVRHGFNQTQVLLHTFTKFGDVVAVKGLTQVEIFQQFIITFGELLNLPLLFAGGALTIMLCAYVVVIKEKKSLDEQRRKLFIILVCLFVGVAAIYFSARNPVWDYHFIGVDLLFMILISLIVAQVRWIRNIITLTVVIVFVLTCYEVSTIVTNPKESELNDQKAVVQTIAKDAGAIEYTVYAYSPSVYMYEYSYLFRWLVNKDVPYDPGQNKTADTVYLIFPTKQDTKVGDFINFRAPQSEYSVSGTWEFGHYIVIKKTRSVRSE